MKLLHARNIHSLQEQARIEASEIATLQVGYLTRPAYEYSHHIKIGRNFGASDGDIRVIVEETNGRPTSLDPLVDILN